MGGKRQGNILSSLITNFETVEQVIETSMNSAGSAYEENAKWLDSIEGKTTQLTNSMQSIWNNAISSETIKFFLDLALSITQVVDKIGLIPSALAAVGTYLAVFKKITPASLFRDLLGGINKYMTAFNQVYNTPIRSTNGILDKASVDSLAQALSGLSAKQQAVILTSNGLTRAQAQQVLTQNGVEASTQKLILGQEKLTLKNVLQATSWKALGASIKTMIETNPIMFFATIATVITGFISKIETAADKTEELAEKYGDLRSKISELKGDIDSKESELESLQEKIEALESKDNLTLSDAEELALLKSESAELERQKEVQEQILAAREQQDQVESLSMINNLISTTAANQEKAAASASEWGKYIGIAAGALLAIGGVALSPLTGGASLYLGAAIGGGVVGASGGSKLFEWLSYEKNEVDSLTEWYDSYTEAINKASQEAQQAESEYLKTLGDTEYEKWQKKVEAVNTLQTEMYDGLQEMQSYINNLEYDDQTKGIIDEYNNLMTHISVKSMDGDINAQIQSLEALKSEYAELSKGVDENGNNIALSAQEYARYQSIVAQLLGYNTGLTQTFDENGSAIKDANGNLVSYNSALTTTIELLKQQQQLAAKNSVGLGDQGNSTFIEAFDNILERNTITKRGDNWYQNVPRAITVSKNPHGFIGGANWGTDDVAEEISKVIGVNFSLNFGNALKYVRENIDLIKENRDQIISQLTSTLQDTNLDDGAISSYVAQVEMWIDTVISESVLATDKAKNELKNLLYIVPQASDSYYNGELSGENLAFINDYIDAYVDGLDDVENLTDEAKTKIRDNILALTNAIGDNPELQEAINKLFALDPSSMPVGEYENAVKSMLSEIFSNDAVEGLFAEAGISSVDLFETLIPNQQQIDTMVNSIQSKFQDGYNNIRDIFTQKELEIIFRATVDMPDGSMTIDKFKEILTNSFAGLNGPIVQTASAMKAEIESFNDVIAQTGEILIDNTEVTQEYKDALIALGISEEELGEFFYDDNKLVVKNADGLKKLVSQTTKLSKAQSQLQYYNLVKQLSSNLTGVKNLTNAEIAETNALVAQISKLQQTIAQYQQLEDTLLGTSNAFKKFTEAQEIDAQNTYGDDFVSMAQAIYDAYELTGQVATAQVDAAVEALIDPSVYAGLEKHSDAYHNAIYNAFNNSVLPTLTLDEDTISLEYDNIESFVLKNLNGIFEGTSVKDFDLAEGINFDDAIEMTGKTRTELYALFAELQKYTGENYLLQLDDSTAGQITKITSDLQELNEQKLSLLTEKNSLEDQKIKLEAEGGEEAQRKIAEINEEIAEIDSQVGKVNTQIDETSSKLGPIADEVRKIWDAYSKADTALETLNQIEDKTAKLTEGQAQDLNIDWKEVEGKSIQETIDYLIEKKLELGEPTPVELQVALDDVEADLAAAQEALKTLKEGGTIDVDLNRDGAIDDANALKTLIEGLEGEKASIILELKTEDGADIGDKVDEVIRQLSIISGVDPVTTLGVDNKEASDKIDETKKEVTDLSNEDPEVTVDADVEDVVDEIDNVSDKMDVIDNQTAAPSVEVKDETTQEKLSEIDAKIEELNQRKVEIYSDPSNIENHTAELTLLEIRLAALNNKKAKIIAEAETEGAQQELTEVEQTAEEMSAEPVTVTVLTETDTEALLGKLQNFQSTYETFKTTIEIGADTTQAEANFTAAVEALNQESPEVLAKLGIDMTSSATQINAVINALTPEIMVNCGLNKTAVDEFVGVEHTANGTVTWSNNKTAVDEYIAEEKTTEGTVIWNNDTELVDEWIAQDHEVDGWVNWYNNIDNVKTSFTATGTVTWTDSGSSEVNGTANASGTAHVNGTAYKGGNWGAPRTETALVGELGPELLVRGNRWTTIGDNGAEFTQIKQGDIIFNHKQTRELLSNGHISGRGKAYASGTAYAGLWGPSGGSGGGSSDDYDDSDYDDYSDSYDDATDSAEEFEETLDWIEILLEEINEQIDLMSAKLENAVGYVNKNSIVDKLIDTNKNKMNKIQQGIEEYKDYLSDLLYEIPSEYRDAAKNGAIDIEEFYGETDEATVEAINNYREWAQKVADLTQQFEELNTEISSLAKQKLDNISDYFSNKLDIYENIEDYVDAYIGGIEEMGYVASQKSYQFLANTTQKRQDLLNQEKDRYLENLNEQVKEGNIKVGSNDWYDAVNYLHELDAEILDCTVQLEEYKNAMNEIKWDNAEQLLDRLNAVADETQNLIDLMEAADDLVDENGEWTKEGIASLGLYAQKMENAAYVADQYARAIDMLNKDYANGLYSEAEYLEKLSELKGEQYEATQAYYDAQDAIVELNKTRVDAVKDGIDKEIKAYEKLIDKKKEELSAEKDLYDFQKSTMEKQENISDIQRKLAALSGDNSASAVAKRKKLEAELAEANADLEDHYYNRSVENKQNALDKELENFKDEKDAEIERLEEYLEKTEQVVADSLNLVKENASLVYDTLGEKASEYNLTLSEAVIDPWAKGELAIGSYQDRFGIAVSYTREELKELKKEWQETIDYVNFDSDVATKNKWQDSNNYVAAKKEEPKKPAANKPNNSGGTNSTNSNGSKPSLTTGTYVEVKPGAKWYSDSYGGGSSGNARSGKIEYINTSGSHAYNIEGLGWIRKEDIVGYASGTKSLKKSGIINVDELGEELIIGAHNGRLTYLEKGSGVVPADLTSNLMSWGELDPQEMLDRNRPTITPSKSVVNNSMELHIDASVGELIHVDHLDGNNLDEITKVIDKAWDKKMQGLNNSLKRFTR